MQLGIVTPVFTRVPGTHSSWEAEAGIEDAARIATKADELGYHHVTCSEHIGIPTEVAKVRGFTYWDPLASFGYLSAVTSRLRFLTHVVVKIVRGKIREIHPLLWAVAVAFAVYFLQYWIDGYLP